MLGKNSEMQSFFLRWVLITITINMVTHNGVFVWGQGAGGDVRVGQTDLVELTHPYGIGHLRPQLPWTWCHAS